MKLGKLPAKIPYGLGTLETYSTAGRLPNPPAQLDYGGTIADWGILGNDQYGDCTLAGTAHLIMAWDAEVDATDTIPSSAQVVDEYFLLTGGGDTGLAESDVLAEWCQKGLFGETIQGYAPVRGIKAIQQAIAFYGGAYLGVQLPQSAEEQFRAGEGWTVQPDSPILGGHAIIAIGYTPQDLRVVTWGKEISVSYPWWEIYGEEAWAILPGQFVEEDHGPAAINLAALKADLHGGFYA